LGDNKLAATDTAMCGEEDLYGDLDESGLGGNSLVLKSRLTQLEESMKEKDQKMENLLKEVEALRSENDKLKEENRVLVRNISCIYRTAVEEINRKQRLMDELRSQRAP